MGRATVGRGPILETSILPMTKIATTPTTMPIFVSVESTSRNNASILKRREERKEKREKSGKKALLSLLRFASRSAFPLRFHPLVSFPLAKRKTQHTNRPAQHTSSVAGVRPSSPSLCPHRPLVARHHATRPQKPLRRKVPRDGRCALLLPFCLCRCASLLPPLPFPFPSFPLLLPAEDGGWSITPARSASFHHLLSFSALSLFCSPAPMRPLPLRQDTDPRNLRADTLYPVVLDLGFAERRQTVPLDRFIGPQSRFRVLRTCERPPALLLGCRGAHRHQRPHDGRVSL